MKDTFATAPVLFKMLDDFATPPKRATDGSAGWDLYALDDHDPLMPGEWKMIGTGASVAIPEGWCGQIWPRSGWALSAGYDTLAGLIDPDYRKELKVLIINHGDDALRLRRGYRVGQIVVVPCLTTSYIVDELPEPASAHDGWGSSGK